MIAFGSSTFIYSAAINNPISNNSELVTPAIDGVTDLLITYLSKGLSFIIDESTDQFSPVPKTDLFFEQMVLICRNLLIYEPFVLTICFFIWYN